MHSLTIAVKDELVSAVSDLTSQRVAELSTILRFAGDYMSSAAILPSKWNWIT